MKSIHHRRILKLAAIACLLLLVVLPVQSAPAQHRALKLTQIHNFLGGFEILIAESAIRMQSTSHLGFTLVAKAPDWKITVFRKDDKTFYSESLRELENTGLVSDFLFTRQERMVDPNHFRLSTMKFGNFDVDRLTSIESTIKALKLKPYGPPQIERIIYAVYKYPTNGGIPITFSSAHFGSDYISGISNKGRTEKFLDTTKISNVMVAPSMFLPPAGLKKAGSLREVVSGNSGRTETQDARVFWDR